VARAHRWVDVPLFSGFTVWLIGSASFSDAHNQSQFAGETLAPTLVFSSLSSPLCARSGEAPTTDEQRHREPPQWCACPPVGGHATVEWLHSVANWLSFFLGPAKARGSTQSISKSMAGGGEDLPWYRPFEQQRPRQAWAQRWWLGSFLLDGSRP
jgi:hypothetical protein